MLDGGDVLRAIWRSKVALLIAFGAFMRLALYYEDRGYWLDEMMLESVIKSTSLAGLLGPLPMNQLAPAGFLVAEKLVTAVLGESTYAFRLPPMLGGLASLFLFRRFTTRWLDPRAAVLALAMFVVAGDLIYFASELKPYGIDVAVALACLLAAERWGTGRVDRRGLARLGIVGVAAPWFSFPAVFVLAGIGLILLLAAAARRDRAASVGLILVGSAWLSSIAVVRAVALRQLAIPRGMDIFWAFSFPERPSSLGGDVSWALRSLAYLFVNPLEFWVPGMGSLPALLAMGLALVGLASLAKLRPVRLGLIVAPMGMGLLAAYLRLYPFHGRLALYAIPTLLVLIAEGVRRVSGTSKPAWILLSALLLAGSIFSDLDHLAGNKWYRDGNNVGDRRPNGMLPNRFPYYYQ